MRLFYRLTLTKELEEFRMDTESEKTRRETTERVKDDESEDDSILRHSH